MHSYDFIQILKQSPNTLKANELYECACNTKLVINNLEEVISALKSVRKYMDIGLLDGIINVLTQIYTEFLGSRINRSNEEDFIERNQYCTDNEISVSSYSPGIRSNSDPFVVISNKPTNSSNSTDFSAQQDSSADPFASPFNTHEDTFTASSNTHEDPFASSSNAREDPFASSSNTREDPFASSSNIQQKPFRRDPFAAPSNKPKDSSKPTEFSTQQDPFADPFRPSFNKPTNSPNSSASNTQQHPLRRNPYDTPSNHLTNSSNSNDYGSSLFLEF